MDLVAARFGAHFGDARRLRLAGDGEGGARRARRLHRATGCPMFGDYQDAMAAGQPTLFHALISTSLNVGCSTRARPAARRRRAWREGRAPLNAVEGFIRQILGWREYVRGIYWHLMPGYARDQRARRRGRCPASTGARPT
jgi:deoxyribodipyrimidine photolyase-related protein